MLITNNTSPQTKNAVCNNFRSLGNGVCNRVRIDDVGSILNFHMDFSFGANSAGVCKFVWIPGSMLNFRMGSVSSIGGLIAATLFAATVSDSQKVCP